MPFLVVLSLELAYTLRLHQLFLLMASLICLHLPSQHHCLYPGHSGTCLGFCDWLAAHLACSPNAARGVSLIISCPIDSGEAPGPALVGRHGRTFPVRLPAPFSSFTCAFAPAAAPATPHCMLCFLLGLCTFHFFHLEHQLPPKT